MYHAEQARPPFSSADIDEGNLLARLRTASLGGWKLSAWKLAGMHRFRWISAFIGLMILNSKMANFHASFVLFRTLSLRNVPEDAVVAG